MERINLTLPYNYKEKLIELANNEGISASELLRRWIREADNHKTEESNDRPSDD